MKKKGKVVKKILSLAIVLSMLLSTMSATAFAFGTMPSDPHGVDMEWYNLRNNQENNGVTERETPIDDRTASLKWGVKYGSGWGAAPTPPLILNSKIYIAQGNKIHELNKETGELIRSSDEMVGNVGYAMNPIIYADGMLYVQMPNGVIQAVDFDTLKCVWHSQKLGGQTVSPISYTTTESGKGYVYTGTWAGENRDGVFFAVSTDIDEGKISDGNGKGGFEKAVTWQFQPSGSSIDKNPEIKYDPDLHVTLADDGNVAKRGFYWAGAYACEKFIAVGSDDGTREGNYTANGVFYTLNPETGDIIDKVSGIKGDIRTSITYDNGRLYFCTKGGKVCRVDVDNEGNLSNYKELQLEDSVNGGNRMITSTPLVYEGKIYMGASGTGGQFDADGGHVFAVIDDTKDDLELMYEIPIAGYPQAAALLTTAYKDIDYDGKDGADGRVYIYFTYNANPGGIYYIYDTPEATSALTQGKELFVPDKSMQQYCISTICADRDGTLYYKNDSCHVMAVENNNAYVKDIKITDNNGTAGMWNESFDQKKLNYDVKLPVNSTSIELELTVPDNISATVNGLDYTEGMKIDLTGETTLVEVTAKCGKDTKIYKINLVKISTDSSLSKIVVSTNNTAGKDELEISPEVTPDNTEYIAEATDVEYKLFWRVWLKTANANSKIEIKAGDNVEKIATGTLQSRGYAGVYAVDKNKSCTVQITVTAEDGKASTVYNLTIQKRVKPTGVVINEQNVNVDVTDAPVKLTAEVSPEDATDKTVKWYAMNPDDPTNPDTAVTVEEDGEGIVTPVKAGKAIITVIPNSAPDLKATTEIEVTDKAAEVKSMVEDLGEITVDSKAKIDLAKAAYDSLNKRQKNRAAVWGVDKAIEKAYSQYELAKAKEEAKASLAAYKDMNDYRAEQQKELKDIIKAAEKVITEAENIEAINTAVETAKAEMDKVKTDAELKAEDIEAAEKVDALIEKIGEVTLESKDKIDEARKAYDNLTDNQKKLVKSLEKLKSAEDKFAKLVNNGNPTKPNESANDGIESIDRNVPKTSDHNALGMWLMILAAATVGLSSRGIRRNKNNN